MPAETMEQTPVAAQTFDANAELDAIVNADKPKPADAPEPEPSQPEPQPAPSDGNQDKEPAPDTRQPSDTEGDEKATDTDKEPDATDKTETTEGDESAEADDATKWPSVESDADYRDALGLSEVDLQNPEYWKDRYENSSREAHRINDEYKALLAMLSDQNVEPFPTSDGKFALRAKEGYGENLSDADLKIPSDLVSKLSAETREILSDGNVEDKHVQEIARVVARQVAEGLKPKALEVSNEPERQSISDRDIDDVLKDFANEKLGDGKTPRFPDADQQPVMQSMAAIYEDPRKADLRAWMNQTKENFRQGIELLYARVYMARAKRVASLQDAERQKAEQTEKQRKDASTSRSSVGQQSHLQQLRNADLQSIAESEMDMIVNATPQ